MEVILTEIEANLAYWRTHIFLINGPITGVNTFKNRAFYNLIQDEIKRNSGSAWMIYNTLFPNNYPSLRFFLQHLNFCDTEIRKIISLY
jgi:hypothetical protein